MVDLAVERDETYFWMALRIPHMYWSTSRPSNNAVLLKGEKKYNLVEAFLISNPILVSPPKTNNFLLTCTQDTSMSPSHS